MERVDQSLAEAAPPATERQLRAFFDLANEAMGLARDGRYVFVNPAFARLFAYANPAEMVGLPTLGNFAEAERPRIVDYARRRAAGEPLPPTYLSRGLRKDGTEFEAELRAFGFREGDAVYTASVVRDVTEARKLERELRESEERFRRSESRLAAIFDAAAEPISFTVGGRFERVNAAFARLFGLARPEDAIDLSVAELVSPAELKRMQERHRQRLAGEPPPAQYTTRGLRRDGTEFDVEVKTAEVREEDRVTTVSVMRDVTEQLAAERRLTESERRFRELFEFVPVSLWEVDASGIHAALGRFRAAGVTDLRRHQAAHPELVRELMGLFRVIDVNAMGRAMAGARTLEELLGHLDKVHVPDSFPRYADLGLQLAEGRSVAYAEGWVGTVEGGRRWIGTTATIVPGHEADWGRVIFASVDLTERRRADEERAALHERLRESEKLEAVGRLAGGIAHDFNNILAAVLSYAELTVVGLEQGSELRDHQERIREAALRARALIRQILTFSRRDVSNQRVVDVPLVVEEALSLMRAGIPSSVTLETRIDPEAGATLADPTQLHQIALNLCSNARDAVGTYGRIEVEVAAVEVAGVPDDVAPGRYVRLRVRDDGVGMAPETKARIFEPYMTTKGPFGGHGLGLPVVHGIVSAARGAIHVESAPGQGSTFDVYLPHHEFAQPELPLRPQRAEGGGERILLVDDEPLVRSAMRRQLESLGYAVEAAEDGRQALARFQATPTSFDLVLTDQTMPHLAGIDLARALLAIRPDLPVVLCTGYSDRIDDAGLRKMGLKGLLLKPADRATVAATLRGALEK